MLGEEKAKARVEGKISGSEKICVGAVFGAISLERERDTLKIKVKYQDLILRISGEYSKERYKFVTRNHQVGQLMRTLQQNTVIKISGNKSLHPITRIIP